MGKAGFDDEDRHLLNAIVQHDRQQFEVLYRKYYRQLFAVALRYVEQVQVAEEIVHDVFIAIWDKAAHLNIQYTVKGYLFKAIVNSALNFIKKNKSDAKKQLQYQSANNTGPARHQAEEADEIMLNALEEALKQLPDKCRQVMYLSRFGKLKQQEIADQLEISIKTVKNHLTYGFQKLRAQLEKQKQMMNAILILLTLLTQK